MVTAATSIDTSRARSELDRAPELTVESLMVRMRSAVERVSSPAGPSSGDHRDNDPQDSAELIQLQVEFNQALLTAVNSITQYLTQSRNAARPMPQKRPAGDIIPRIEQVTEQINDFDRRLAEAMANLRAADESQRVLIDDALARLEAVCQMTSLSQQQAAADIEVLRQCIAQSQATVDQARQESATAYRHAQAETAQTELRLLRLERDRRRAAPITAAAIDPSSDRGSSEQAISTSDIPFDYLLFEHRFRGPTEDIKQRQQAYLEYFQSAQSVLDLGCGRGEFVELLAEHDVPVIGVDCNEDAVDFCKARGLPVLRGDLIAYLTAQGGGSVGGIFMAQVVEHLPADCVWKLIQLAARKLQTDGVVLLETINPHCLPAMNWFYLDPTHVRPYPPALLAFMCQQAGLRLECVQFSAPLASATAGPFLKSSQDVPPEGAMHYQDYAVIARRVPAPI